MDASENIRKLHGRMKEGQYRAQPLRRIYIPKEDGRQRPISIPSLEDKIVQRAAADLLNAIYEQDFRECSYGFRPGRGSQDALDEVGRVVCRRPISAILEADITGYFDAIVRSLLTEMIEKRVSDGRILRLIGKWINVGAIEDGRLLVTETGTVSGGRGKSVGCAEEEIREIRVDVTSGKDSADGVWAESSGKVRRGR